MSDKTDITSIVDSNGTLTLAQKNKMLDGNFLTGSGEKSTQVLVEGPGGRKELAIKITPVGKFPISGVIGLQEKLDQIDATDSGQTQQISENTADIAGISSSIENIETLANEAKTDADAALTEISEAVEQLDGIAELIPSQAAADNQLADKAFVNSSINSNSANRVYADAGQGYFDTRAALEAATEFYNAHGEEYTPSNNDYTIVLADEGAPAPFTGGQTRWKWTGTPAVLGFDYGINETPFTAAQQAALDSGVSSSWKSGVDSFTGRAAGFATAAQGTKADNALPKSGGTMTGALVLAGAPTGDNMAATKAYADSRPGPSGPQGPTGQQGPQGLRGPEGPQGITGPQGYQGITGSQGVRGFQGDTGPQGYQGVKGDQGNQGTQGPQGNQGPQGFQGAVGSQGPQGYQGVKGNTGAQGEQGFSVRKVGMIFADYSPNCQADEHLLDGATIAASIYPDLKAGLDAYLASNTDPKGIYSRSIADWDNAYALNLDAYNNASVPFIGYDSSTGQLKFPLMSAYTALTQADAANGPEWLNDAIRNIRFGGVPGIRASSWSQKENIVDRTGSTITSWASSGSSTPYGFTYDAGATQGLPVASENRNKQITAYFKIIVSGTPAIDNPAQINAAAVITQVNQLTQNILANNKMSLIQKPDWSGAISITYSTGTYTAPKDGQFFWAGGDVNSSVRCLYVNGIAVGCSIVGNNADLTSSQSVIVNKNDLISWDVGSPYGGAMAKFVPFADIDIQWVFDGAFATYAALSQVTPIYGHSATVLADETHGGVITEYQVGLDGSGNPVWKYKNPISLPDNFDVVVETATGITGTNYINGWYRKYRSGWIEQGLEHQSTASGQATFTLPIAMANANYSVMAIAIRSAGTSSAEITNSVLSSKTNTTFSIYVSIFNQSGVFCEVKGYAA